MRFEVALRTLAPELEILAPVRDKAFKRQEELEFLQQRKSGKLDFAALSAVLTQLKKLELADDPAMD